LHQTQRISFLFHTALARRGGFIWALAVKAAIQVTRRLARVGVCSGAFKKMQTMRQV